jgi:hypothetical protein
MKNIICFTTLLFIFASITFSQSVIDYQTGTALTVQPGADISAGQVQINGTYTGGGTINGSIAYALNLTAFIQGFYNSSSNTMVSDTIIIYLRSAVSPYAKVDSAKSVLSNSGAGSFIFFNVTNATNYYVVIKHRNSIETWSSTVQAFLSAAMTYDFTPAANKAYGNNQAQIDSSPIKFGIYSGDVNQDGIVDIIDNGLIDNDSYNFITGYVRTDVNGDNAVDLSDAAIADNNGYNFVIVRRP